MSDVLFIATVQDERQALLIRQPVMTTTLAFFEPVLKDMKPKVMEKGRSISYVKASPYIGERAHYIQMRSDILHYNGGEFNENVVHYVLDELMHELLKVLRQGWYEVPHPDWKEGDDLVDKVPLVGIIRAPAENYLEWAKGYGSGTWFLFSGGQVGQPFFEKDKWDWRLVNGQP